MKFNAIRLLVNDFDACFEFYSSKLGLKVTWGKPGGDYASFEFEDGAGLSIFKSDLMAAAIGNSEKKLPESSREKVAVIVQVQDVDETYEKLENVGVKFINKPKDMTGWGMRAVHLRDPEKNLIEFWSELEREKWDKDLLADAEEFNY